MTTSANQIQLIGDFRREEMLTAEALYPGHLCEQTSATSPTVQKHSTEGGYAERIVAVEDALQGNTISTVYASGALASLNIVAPGAVVQMFLQAGENVSIGDKLISAGDGTLIANGSESSGVTVRQIIAVAQEALDLSASGDVDTLMDVRVL